MNFYSITEPAHGLDMMMFVALWSVTALCVWRALGFIEPLWQSHRGLARILVVGLVIGVLAAARALPHRIWLPENATDWDRARTTAACGATSVIQICAVLPLLLTRMLGPKRWVQLGLVATLLPLIGFLVPQIRGELLQWNTGVAVAGNSAALVLLAACAVQIGVGVSVIMAVRTSLPPVRQKDQGTLRTVFRAWMRDWILPPWLERLATKPTRQTPDDDWTASQDPWE